MLVSGFMNTAVWARGTNTSGAQLKQFVEEYSLSASPTDGKAQQLKATMGKADWSAYDPTTMLCLVGYGVVVGKLVWDTRMVRDHCGYAAPETALILVRTTLCIVITTSGSMAVSWTRGVRSKVIFHYGSAYKV